MKRILFLTVLIAALLAWCTALAADTTVMMYMCGTDLQSDCIKDLQEMCKANADDHVRIVVLAGGAKKWDDKRLTAGRLNLFTIENGTFSAVTDWGKASMGSPDTLERFVTYAWQNYRSERNMLVLWDHGGGTAQGVCFDEVFRDDGLTLTETSAALAAVRARAKDFRLDVFGCDACLMAGYELAVVAKDYADYFIASEELEPDLGWYYTDWLKALNADPGMSTEQLCRNIVDAYSAACKRDRAAEYTTLSVIDLRRLDPLLQDMEQLGAYLTDALEHGQLATLSRGVGRMYAMGSYESSNADNDMYDLAQLLDLSEQFAPETVAAARQHLAQAVVVSYTSGDAPSACGLAVYIPQVSRKYYVSETQAGYDLAGAIPQYTGFVAALAGQMNGNSYTFTATTPTTQTAGTISTTATQFAGYIPMGSWNAETGTVPSFIAGTAGQAGGTTQAGGQTTGGVPPFIAGTAGQAGGQTTAAQQLQAIDIAGVPSFIVGSVSGATQAQTQVQAVAATDLAFALKLDPRDLENLNYAEGAVFMDLSDDDGVWLVELGYLRNSWVDWAGSTVYSTFDGSWPTLDGQMVVVYDRSWTEMGRRSLIPVKVNGEETMLVVSFAAGSTQGTILGHNAGVDENGLLLRHVEPLKAGDVIVPQYTMYYCGWDEADSDEDMEEITVEGDPIVWRAGMTVEYQSMADPEAPMDYQFAFYLNDIFGDYDMTDFIPFTM